jgi:hypothetical protein
MSEWNFFLLWFVVPICHFFLWRYLGGNYYANIEVVVPIKSFTPCISVAETAPIVELNYSQCQRSMYKRKPQFVESNLTIDPFDFGIVKPVGSSRFDQFKSPELAVIKSPSQMLITLTPHLSESCLLYTNLISSVKNTPKSCVAIAWSSSIQHTQYLARFNSDSKKTGRILDPENPKSSGFFRNVAKSRGRVALLDKAGRLFSYLLDVEDVFKKILTSRAIYPGDNIVLMVVNDGEIDLYLNFACSCRAHSISLHNMIVLTASA